MSKDIKIAKPYAKIEELDKRYYTEPIDNVLRFYKSSPEGFTLQIRKNGTISHGSKVKRNMIASVELSLEEIRYLAAEAEKMLLPNEPTEMKRFVEGDLCD